MVKADIKFINFILIIAITFPLINISYSEVENVSNNESDPQIERGQPNIIFDSVGNILSLPKKIILLNPNIDSHNVSPETEKFIKEFIHDNSATMKDVKVRINEFAPFGEFGRLVKNKKISWWWRIFPGIPVTLFSSLTGRLLGGDHYNPYTDTIHIFSNEPAVVLHEAAHAKDMAEKIKGPEADFYAIGRIFPGVTLYQEFTASDEAVEYLKQKGNRKEELSSYRTLYPAYGTYVGSYSGFQYGDIAGAVAGQGVAIWKQHERKIYYSVIDNIKMGNVVKDLETDPLAHRLLQDERQKEKSLQKAFTEVQLIKLTE